MRHGKPDTQGRGVLCNPRAGGAGGRSPGFSTVPKPKVCGASSPITSTTGAALADVGQRADLVCIYGGDGTIYHVINEMLRIPPNGHPPPRIFLLGGGTMNVTATKLAMSGTPANNFRAVISAYHAGTLRYRQVPLIAVRTGARFATASPSEWGRRAVARSL